MQEDSSDAATPPFADQLEDRPTKKRRLQGACDVCRKKKVRCDSAKMPNNECSNCIALNISCTHAIPRHSKKESYKGYIRTLENRLDKMEQLLRTARLEVNSIPQKADQISEGKAKFRSSAPDSFPELTLPTPSLEDVKYVPSSSSVASDDTAEADEFAHVALSEQFHRLSLNMVENKFFGKSSGFNFMQQATDVRDQVSGTPNNMGRNFRRPTYWEIEPWEKFYANGPDLQLVFPDQDLLISLIDIYFSHVNIIYPLLHRPTFEKSIAIGQHLWDQQFGMVVLMICAVSSRYSSDRRVLVEDDLSGLSCGWKYFRQVPLVRNSLLYESTIYNLQYYNLAILYLVGTSSPQAAWNILGLGIRHAQERGAHRRKGVGIKPTVEDELWKRSFWCLISMDRIMSSFLGRPSAIQAEDFDVDLPAECDDEYWECADPEMNFKQPPGKPSLISAFNQHLKLFEMLAFTLRTLYPTRKSKTLIGLVGDQWDQKVVSDLDSAMNRWKDSLPEHLRWDPSQRNRTFLHQSSSLYATFSYLQIQVHRPFLRKNSPLSFSSLALCTNAARSCSNVLDDQAKRGLVPFPNIIIASFACGIVLLLNSWGSNRTDTSNKEMAKVEKIMNVLRGCENRWHIAGRLLDLLIDLGTAREGPHRQQIASENSEAISRGTLPSHNEDTNLNPIYVHSSVQETQMPNRHPAGVNAMNDHDNILAHMGCSYTTLDPQVQTNAYFIQQPTLSAETDSYSSVREQHRESESVDQDTQDADGDVDMMHLWFDAPLAFNIEEWDAYITNMGGVNGLTYNRKTF